MRISQLFLIVAGAAALAGCNSKATDRNARRNAGARRRCDQRTGRAVDPHQRPAREQG